MRLPAIRSRRGACTALSLISAVLLVTLSAGSPLRPLAGLLLAGPMPAWSIDRLVLAHSRQRPSAEVRWSLAVGFALVAVLAVGLLLAVTPVKMKVLPVVIGLLIVIAVCDLTSATATTASAIQHRHVVAIWGLIGVALGLGIASFVFARDSAVSASRRQATASLYLLGGGSRKQVILANPTAAAQRFAVVVDRSGMSPAHLTSALGPRTQVRLPAAMTSRPGRQQAFTVTATVVSGPQRGVTLRLSAPASG